MGSNREIPLGYRHRGAGRAVREGAKRRPWRGTELVHDAGRIRVNLPCGSCPRALGRHVAAWVAENVERPPGQAILLQEVPLGTCKWVFRPLASFV